MTQLRTGLWWGLGLLVAVGLLGMPGGAEAQDETPPPSQRTFGTAVPVVHTVHAYSFLPVSSSTTYSAVGPVGRLACTGGVCFFVASVFLPAGALVAAIQGELYDSDAGTNMGMTFSRVTSPQGIVTSLANGQTFGSPGCGFVTVPLAVPETIDNQNHLYSLTVSMGSTSGTRFFAVFGSSTRSR